jgi:hypothetical protein
MKTKNNEIDQTAVAMQCDLLSNTQDINNVLSTANNVSPLFMGHYFNMESGEHGIETLIMEILRSNDSVFKASVSFDSKGKHEHYKDNSLRSVVIAHSMFTEDIIFQVQSRFTAGSKRYPYVTIHAYLSMFMQKAGTVGKVKLTNAEDKPRPCFKPRCKWFIIE